MSKDLHLLRARDYREKLAQCIHCGMCLQSCPTYAIFGTEMDAPRGRIALMQAAAQGRIGAEAIRDVFGRHILLCLACRACETACPSGVQYGALVEMARVVVEHNRRAGLKDRLLRLIGIQILLPNLKLLKLLARALWIYETIGVQRGVRSFSSFLPKAVNAMEKLLPPIRLRFTPLGKTLPARGGKKGKVLFFTGCVQEAFLSQVNEATIRVLRRNGFDVYAPAGQTCCAAAHLHLGDLENARKLARRNIDVFLSAGEDYEAVICNAGGCGLALKEYPSLLSGEPGYADRAKVFSSKIRDISEFLYDHLTRPPDGEIRARATYADSCHLRHGQKIIAQPRELLKKIPGLELVELSRPDLCCGSAGVYNIAQAETADAVLEAKMADIAATHPDIILTSSTGCQMQFLAGVREAGWKAEVMHVVEILDLSYQRAEQIQNLGSTL